MAKVLFIGTGMMGGPMAANLLRAGHEVVVHSRTRERAEPVLAQGARWADSRPDAAREVECVITMVGGPPDVEQIHLGELVEVARPGTLLVDMTTSSPQLAERIHVVALRRGLRALDAPVTGGPQGAQAGTLTVMVGGDAADLEAARPVLRAMGRNLMHYGRPGNGQRAKLVNQTVGMLNMLSAIEGLFFAKKAGLDTGQILHMLQNGLTESRSLHGLAPLALKGEFPPNFHPAHVVKDLSLAVAEAEAIGIDLPALRTARDRWAELVRRYPQAAAVHEIARLYE
ncbi:NAD(P)-dependent oxidoreductase [Ramlibacter sp. AW1]|uniref:NAD(P)-dependent oxidoreductase n=2 Tax=Ramlibacter aurantiacus TaxID=2801330 RepID=A0A936ZR61_9BURK|nr:NAD(P)-dependent oxidoreductase [Ramlibacter aurantiacus]